MKLGIMHLATISLILGLFVGVTLYQDEIMPTVHQPKINVEIILFYCRVHETSINYLQNKLASAIVVLNITNHENERIRLSSIEVVVGREVTRSGGSTSGYVVNMPVFKKVRYLPQRDESSYVPPFDNKYISISGMILGISTTEITKNLSILIIVSGYYDDNTGFEYTKLVNISLEQPSPSEYYYQNIPQNMLLEFDEYGDVHWIRVGS